MKAKKQVDQPFQLRNPPIEEIERARQLWVEACEVEALAKDKAREAELEASRLRAHQRHAAELRDEAWSQLKFAEMAAKDRGAVQ